MNNGIIGGLTVVCLVFSCALFAQPPLPASLRNYVLPAEWSELSPRQQQTLIDLQNFATAEPKAFSSVSPPCWHHATDAATADLIEGIHEQLMEDFAADRFYTLRRWESGTYLATPGNSLQTGDPITVTWSYLPDGAVLDLGCNTSTDAPSDLVAFLTTIFGSGPTVPGDYSTAPWHPIFVDAFAEWEAESGLHFVYEPNDDGARAADTDLANHAYGQLGVRGDLRIGGRNVDGYGGILACAQFPYNGEIIFDTGDGYYQNQINTDGSVSNTFFNIISHEIGHALGFLHVRSDNHDDLMEPYVQAGFRGVQHAERLASNHYYGDQLEQGNTAATAAILDLTAAQSGIALSLDATTDLDHYLITPTATGTLHLTITPEGEPNYGYRQSVYQPLNVVNTLQNANLAVQLFDHTTETSIVLSDATGAGAAEQLTALVQAGRTYRIEVSGTFTAPTDAVTSTQLYTLTSAGAVLPVEWASFEGQHVEPATNRLTWSTALERNAAYFAVERSPDGSAFTELNRVSATGNSDTQQFYSFDDAAVADEWSYYRLRQVDLDGTYAYSETITVQAPPVWADHAVFPNPAGAEIHLVRSAADDDERVRTYDALGRLVMDFNWAAGSVRERVAIRALLPGVYTTRISGGSYPRTLRWSKQ